MVVERIRSGIFSPAIIFDEDWSLSIWDLFLLLLLLPHICTCVDSVKK
jgi:hypothetical protein